MFVASMVEICLVDGTMILETISESTFGKPVSTVCTFGKLLHLCTVLYFWETSPPLCADMFGRLKF